MSERVGSRSDFSPESADEVDVAGKAALERDGDDRVVRFAQKGFGAFDLRADDFILRRSTEIFGKSAVERALRDVDFVQNVLNRNVFARAFPNKGQRGFDVGVAHGVKVARLSRRQKTRRDVNCFIFRLFTVHFLFEKLRRAPADRKAVSVDARKRGAEKIADPVVVADRDDGNILRDADSEFLTQF